jgi:hypothetical protein
MGGERPFSRVDQERVRYAAGQGIFSVPTYKMIDVQYTGRAMQYVHAAINRTTTMDCLQCGARKESDTNDT